MDRQYGPQLLFSDTLHQDKYRLPNESFRESINRSAAALKDDEEHFRQLRPILLDMRFMFGGRIQAAMGSPKAVTPYNCFVSGTIEDSFVDGDGSIMQRAAEAAQTMRLGGGIGYDFSPLRPNGDLIRGVMSRTDGPMAFLPIFNAVCQATSSAGNRRGAQMGVLRIDHPDIEEFIRIKQTTGVLEGFNLSIAVTDDFMECLAEGRLFQLKWGGKVYREVDPAALWEMVMRSTWDWGEPGVLFIDTINRFNNLWYCETLAATNPCGEQPLPPFGACLLGSYNLVKYIEVTPHGYKFNWVKFQANIPPIVRALDNVIDRARYPLPEQKLEAVSKRRIGIGITGLANAAEALGLPYATPGFIEFELQILEVLRTGAYLASTQLAHEKGVFPKYNRDCYLSGEHIKTLPDYVRAEIYKNGMRNSHLLSIAPTGTISFCADYVSSAIEPVFKYEDQRLVLMPSGQIEVDVSDYGFREFKVEGRLARDVTAQEHIDVLAAAAALVDSAVAKTCNVNGSMSWEDFKGLYVQAWERGCKGCTTFNEDGKRAGILSKAKVDKIESACSIDPASGRRECS